MPAHEIDVTYLTDDHIAMYCSCGWKYISEKDISYGVPLKELTDAAEAHQKDKNAGSETTPVDSPGEDRERQNLVGRSWLR